MFVCVWYSVWHVFIYVCVRYVFMHVYGMIVCIEWRSVLFCLCVLCVAHMLLVYHASVCGISVCVCSCVVCWCSCAVCLSVYMHVCMSVYVYEVVYLCV